MKHLTSSKKMTTKMLALSMMCLSMTVFAQGGAAALTNAASEVKSYWEPVKLIIMAVGGVVGLIGGVRIYNKWSNGDQDINKEVVGWGGACLFLIIVPQFVSSFFG